MGPKKGKGKGGPVDGVDTTSMSREQLEAFALRLREELDREREERNFFQLERDKLRTFWEITRQQFEETRAQLRNQDRIQDENEEKHQSEIKAFKQKVKHLLYEHQCGLSDLKVEGVVALKMAQDEYTAMESELLKDKHALKAKLKEQELAHQEVIRQLKMEHSAEVSKLREQFSQDAIELEKKYETRQSTQYEEQRLQHTMELGEVEQRKNRQVVELTKSHEQAFNDMKNYYNDITLNNLALISSLKEQMEELRNGHERMEKQLREVQGENKRLSEPLKQARAELSNLQRQLASYEQDKLTLSNTKQRLALVTKELEDLRWENEVLELRFDKVEKERNRLHQEFVGAVLDVQQKTGLKSAMLEKKIADLRGGAVSYAPRPWRWRPHRPARGRPPPRFRSQPYKQVRPAAPSEQSATADTRRYSMSQPQGSSPLKPKPALTRSSSGLSSCSCNDVVQTQSCVVLTNRCSDCVMKRLVYCYHRGQVDALKQSSFRKDFTYPRLKCGRRCKKCRRLGVDSRNYPQDTNQLCIKPGEERQSDVAYSGKNSSAAEWNGSLSHCKQRYRSPLLPISDASVVVMSIHKQSHFSRDSHGNVPRKREGGREKQRMSGEVQHPTTLLPLPVEQGLRVKSSAAQISLPTLKMLSVEVPLHESARDDGSLFELDFSKNVDREIFIADSSSLESVIPEVFQGPGKYIQPAITVTEAGVSDNISPDFETSLRPPPLFLRESAICVEESSYKLCEAKVKDTSQELKDASVARRESNVKPISSVMSKQSAWAKAPERDTSFVSRSWRPSVLSTTPESNRSRSPRPYSARASHSGKSPDLDETRDSGSGKKSSSTSSRHSKCLTNETAKVASAPPVTHGVARRAARKRECSGVQVRPHTLDTSTSVETVYRADICEEDTHPRSSVCTQWSEDALVPTSAVAVKTEFGNHVSSNSPIRRSFGEISLPVSRIAMPARAVLSEEEEGRAGPSGAFPKVVPGLGADEEECPQSTPRRDSTSVPPPPLRNRAQSPQARKAPSARPRPSALSEGFVKKSRAALTHSAGHGGRLASALLFDPNSRPRAAPSPEDRPGSCRQKDEEPLTPSSQPCDVACEVNLPEQHTVESRATGSEEISRSADSANTALILPESRSAATSALDLTTSVHPTHPVTVSVGTSLINVSVLPEISDTPQLEREYAPFMRVVQADVSITASPQLELCQEVTNNERLIRTQSTEEQIASHTNTARNDSIAPDESPPTSKEPPSNNKHTASFINLAEGGVSSKVGRTHRPVLFPSKILSNPIVSSSNAKETISKGPTSVEPESIPRSQQELSPGSDVPLFVLTVDDASKQNVKTSGLEHCAGVKCNSSCGTLLLEDSEDELESQSTQLTLGSPDKQNASTLCIDEALSPEVDLIKHSSETHFNMEVSQHFDPNGGPFGNESSGVSLRFGRQSALDETSSPSASFSESVFRPTVDEKAFQDVDSLFDDLTSTVVTKIHASTIQSRVSLSEEQAESRKEAKHSQNDSRNPIDEATTFSRQTMVENISAKGCSPREPPEVELPQIHSKLELSISGSILSDFKDLPGMQSAAQPKCSHAVPDSHADVEIAQLRLQKRDPSLESDRTIEGDVPEEYEPSVVEKTARVFSQKIAVTETGINTETAEEGYVGDPAHGSPSASGSTLSRVSSTAVDAASESSLCSSSESAGSEREKHERMRFQKHSSSRAEALKESDSSKYNTPPNRRHRRLISTDDSHYSTEKSRGLLQEAVESTPIRAADKDSSLNLSARAKSRTSVKTKSQGAKVFIKDFVRAVTTGKWPMRRNVMTSTSDFSRGRGPRRRSAPPPKEELFTKDRHAFCYDSDPSGATRDRHRGPAAMDVDSRSSTRQPSRRKPLSGSPTTETPQRHSQHSVRFDLNDSDTNLSARSGLCNMSTWTDSLPSSDSDFGHTKSLPQLHRPRRGALKRSSRADCERRSRCRSEGRLNQSNPGASTDEAVFLQISSRTAFERHKRCYEERRIHPPTPARSHASRPRSDTPSPSTPRKSRSSKVRIKKDVSKRAPEPQSRSSAREQVSHGHGTTTSTHFGENRDKADADDEKSVARQGGNEVKPVIWTKPGPGDVSTPSFGGAMRLMFPSTATGARSKMNPGNLESAPEERKDNGNATKESVFKGHPHSSNSLQNVFASGKRYESQSSVELPESKGERQCAGTTRPGQKFDMGSTPKQKSERTTSGAASASSSSNDSLNILPVVTFPSGASSPWPRNKSLTNEIVIQEISIEDNPCEELTPESSSGLVYSRLSCLEEETDSDVNVGGFDVTHPVTMSSSQVDDWLELERTLGGAHRHARRCGLRTLPRMKPFKLPSDDDESVEAPKGVRFRSRSPEPAPAREDVPTRLLSPPSVRKDKKNPIDARAELKVPRVRFVEGSDTIDFSEDDDIAADSYFDLHHQRHSGKKKTALKLATSPSTVKCSSPIQCVRSASSVAEHPRRILVSRAKSTASLTGIHDQPTAQDLKSESFSKMFGPAGQDVMVVELFRKRQAHGSPAEREFPP